MDTQIAYLLAIAAALVAWLCFSRLSAWALEVDVMAELNQWWLSTKVGQRWDERRVKYLGEQLRAVYKVKVPR